MENNDFYVDFICWCSCVGVYGFIFHSNGRHWQLVITSMESLNDGNSTEHLLFNSIPKENTNKNNVEKRFQGRRDASAQLS